MRKLILIFSCLAIFSCSKDLSESEIQKILDKSENYKGYTLKKKFAVDFIKKKNESEINNKLIKNENFRSSYKIDFNKDGYPDYLLNLELKTTKDSIKQILPLGEYYDILILLSKDKNDFNLVNFENKEIYFDIIGAKPIKDNLFEIMRVNPRLWEWEKNKFIEKINLKIDNNVITEISKNQHSPIDKIIFKEFGGWSGENFTLELREDSILLNSKNFKKLDGKYFVKNKNEFQNISNYLNRIGFVELKDKYQKGCSDCGSHEINIFYNSSEKNINDYGSKGTLGLVKFYKIIDAFMESQKWQKID